MPATKETIAPAQGGAARSDGEPDWDAVLAQATAMGLTPEMARRILSMNPKLRQDGFDTVKLVAKSEGSARASSEASAPTIHQQRSSVFAMLATQRAQLEEREAHVQREIVSLQESVLELRQRSCEEVTRWLMANDRELLSPVTQQALSDDRRFLERVGFTIAAYVDRVRRAAKR